MAAVRSRVAKVAGLLCLALLFAAGCGGGSKVKGKVENRPAPPSSSFPSAKGKTLAQVLNEASAPSGLVLSPTQSVFQTGANRFAFGAFTTSKKAQVADAKVALYVAKAPPPGKLPQAKANGASAGTGPLSKVKSALGNPASGPYPARVESLETEPAFRSQTTAKDPQAGKVVYVTQVNFPSNGEWQIGALVKEGDKLTTRLLGSASVGKFKSIPQVGQRPPAIHTPTLASVGNDRSKLTTRVPPEVMNKADFADVLGKKPIVLLFATPVFCQSRVCGPVTDIAAQVQRDYGNKAEFIHMEIYNDNNPSKGVRPQVRAFNLPSEPWLFVIDRNGIIRTRIEGAFNVQELTAAVKGVTGG
jgi:hypothetical protein